MNRKTYHAAPGVDTTGAHDDPALFPMTIRRVLFGAQADAVDATMRRCRGRKTTLQWLGEIAFVAFIVIIGLVVILGSQPK